MMIDLGTLGGASSFAYGVNRAGQVVGAAAVGASSTSHAFLYSAGRMTDLGTLGGTSSVAQAINAAGQITGSAQPGGGAPLHAFLYSGGAMTDLGTLGGPASFAYAINGLGDVVGWVADEDEPARAFLYADGVMTDLNTLIPVGSGWTVHEARAINDGRQVAAVGALLSGADHALLLTPLDVPT